MGVTNFPDGINAGSQAGGTAPLQVGGTAINPPNHVGATAAPKMNFGSVVVTGGSINVATGLATVLNAQATPLGPLSSTAGTVGGFVIVTAAPIGASGGSIAIRAYDQNGTAASSSGTAFWQAFGT